MLECSTAQNAFRFAMEILLSIVRSLTGFIYFVSWTDIQLISEDRPLVLSNEHGYRLFMETESVGIGQFRSNTCDKIYCTATV